MLFTLKNKKLKTELHFRDDEKIKNVIVVDTRRGLSCEYEAIFAHYQFTDDLDTYVTEKQLEWLDSQKVFDWLEKIGYGQNNYNPV